MNDAIIQTIFTMDQYEIGALSPLVLQGWLRQLSQEVLDLRKELQENHNFYPNSTDCKCCGMEYQT